MTIKQQKISNTMTNGNKIRMFTNHVCSADRTGVNFGHKNLLGLVLGYPQ